MKGIIAVLICFCTLLFAGCKQEQMDNTYYVDYFIEEVVYETADNIWNQDDVFKMIDYYYDKRAEDVDVKITMTFTAKDDFHYAELTGEMGVGEINGLNFKRQNYIETIGSMGKDAELLSAGIYEIVLYAEDVCFFKNLAPFIYTKREEIKIKLELNLSRI